jgi:hypothetical protein
MYMVSRSTTFLQVRVRAGVQVSSDPLVYEYGQPTNWELANSVVEVIPSPPRKQSHKIHVVHLQGLHI